MMRRWLTIRFINPHACWGLLGLLLVMSLAVSRYALAEGDKVVGGVAPTDDNDDGYEEGETDPTMTASSLKNRLALNGLSPEEVLGLVQTRLGVLKQRVTGFEQIYLKEGVGEQTTLADHARRMGLKDFTNKEYDSAIINFTNYLNWTQVSKIPQYLEVQYYLAKSYEATRKDKKAIKAFARYLATQATNPELISERTTDVMDDMLVLIERNRMDPSEFQLNPLMAALTSLDLPTQQKAKVFFYAGKAARLSGNQKDGLFWLDKATQFSNNPYLIARARYNRALIHIQNQRYGTALIDLEAALKEDSNRAYDFREYAKLAMARVNVYLKKPKTALTFYNDIDDGSDAYREAVYEKIYVYLDTQQYKEAILASEEYLIRFPLADDTYQVRTIKAYLDLKNDDLTSAAENIKLGNERLASISQWLKDNYGQRETLTGTDVNGIIKVTHSEVSQPPIILRGQKLFNTLQSTALRLSELRNDIRNTVFSLGRANINVLNPSWQNRLNQLKHLMEEVLDTGDLLTQAESKLYEGRLSPKDQYLLKASHERRMKNFSTIANFTRSKGPWQEWALLGEVSARMSRRYHGIKELKAQLVALKLLIKTKKIPRGDARMSEIIELEAEGNRLENQLLRAIEVSRSRQAMLAVALSGLNPLKIATKNYAENLFDEQATLAQYRHQFVLPDQKHRADDLTAVWQQWEYLLTTAYTQVINLQKEITDAMQARLVRFDELIAEHDKLKEELDKIDTNLALKLGANLGLILEHYHYRIAERMAKHQKWQADLHWLAFDQTGRERQKANDKYELEQQILKENLKDLEQGVLAKWP